VHGLEGPLVDINSWEEFEKWRGGQPREVSVALAARAALRVLPLLCEALRHKPNYVVLPVFRALAVAWTAAKYSLTKGYDAPSVDLGQFGLASRAAVHAAVAAQAARVTVSDPSLAAEVFRRVDDAVQTAVAHVDIAALWCAVSKDATRIEEGKSASIIAGSPLWPQVQPDWVEVLWQELKQALLGVGQDWPVWITWYDDRLAGDVRKLAT
jgi:hypothetical protein